MKFSFSCRNLKQYSYQFQIFYRYDIGIYICTETHLREVAHTFVILLSPLFLATKNMARSPRQKSRVNIKADKKEIQFDRSI